MNVRQSIGTVECLCCGEVIPVKSKEGSALSVSCPWCDLSAYAKPGTQAFKLIASKIAKPAAVDTKTLPLPGIEPKPAAPKPAPAAKPARSTIFG